MDSPRRARRAYALPLACLVAVLALAGCSDSKKSDSATAGSTTPNTLGRTVDTNFTGEGSAEFCQYLKTFASRMQSMGQATNAAEVNANLRQVQESLDQAVAQAPPDVKDNMATLAATVGTVVTTVINAGGDTNKMTDALTALQSEGFADAVTRLTAYLTSKCGATG
jgi:hypothetical protein